MSTLYDNMLNEYLRADLIYNSIYRYTYFLEKIKKATDWKGGAYPIPFYGNGASSISSGSGLTPIAEISRSSTIRGYMDAQIRIKAALAFNEDDEDKHDSGSKKDSFMAVQKHVTFEIAQMLNKTRQSLNMKMLTGFLSRATGAGNASGEVSIDRVEIFEIGQKLIFREKATPASVAGWISKINLETDTITVATDATLATALDFTALGAGFITDDEIFLDGDVDLATHMPINQMNTLRDILLSNSAGGPANLYGIAKADYTFLQGINADGSGITGSNILDEIFNIYSMQINRKVKKGLGNTKPKDVLLNTKLYTLAMAQLEADEKNASAYNVSSMKKTKFHYDSVAVKVRRGLELNIIEVPELSSDIIPIIDANTFTHVTNGKLRQKGQKHGNSGLFLDRNSTSGFTYVWDAALDGNVVCDNPQANAIIHSVSV